MHAQLRDFAASLDRVFFAICDRTTGDAVGVATYLDVITAQQSLLSVQLQAAQLAGQRQLAATALVKALGGGWSTGAS